MKLAADALLEIVDIVRNGLTKGEDISQTLRELDLEVNPEAKLVQLSKDFKAKRGR